MRGLSPPIFVVGNARSGTTLLRLMLTCHRNIVMVPECGFAVWLYGKYRHWDGDLETARSQFVPDLFQCRKFETWEIDREGLLALIEAERPSSYAELAACVYVYYGLRRGRTFARWGDKNTFYERCIPDIVAIFPSACVLHIVRDGRDVACSYRDLNRRPLAGPYVPKLPDNVGCIAAQWSATVDGIRNALSGIPKSQTHEVRFEDLVRQPTAVLETICHFLREDFDPGMLRYHEQNRLHDLEPSPMMAWKEKTREAPRADVIGRFERELSREEKESFLATAQGTLRTYGYI